ncbi:MAG: MBL fold metallo-hydrolase [Oscillospiraceae bacterium]|nr:MBL fold metallo-hydrolase [Oscillospiraceae bacterium]
MSELKPIEPTRKLLIPYLEELRKKYEHAVYPIDRFAEVFHIRENIYAIFIPAPHHVEDNWVYLIVGPDRALLIDNGFGIGDLRGLCEMLAGKEVVTTVTHFHGDHAWGSSQWDWIYCHEYTKLYLERQLQQDMMAWWDEFNYVGTEHQRDFYTHDDIINLKPYGFKVLENHEKIDLGGDYKIEMVHMAGHSPDEVGFLDPQSRIFFSGDSLFESRFKGLGVGIHSAKGRAIHPEVMGILFYHKKISELCERIDEFDYVMAGHGYLDSPASIAEDCKRAVEAVMKDPYDYDTTVQRHRGISYIKSGGKADIMYEPEDIINELTTAGLWNK